MNLNSFTNLKQFIGNDIVVSVHNYRNNVYNVIDMKGVYHEKIL